MTTQIFAVCGNPILHSKSPNMFNAVFRSLNLDAEYLYFAAETAEEAVFLFRQLGAVGMNVTSPFKETIVPLLDVVHSEAQILNSVNTVVLQDGKLHGYNTDFYGVTQSFSDAKIQLQGKRCIVIGAGGAGKAAAYGLHSLGADVTIVNRTAEKAQQAAQTIGCGFAEFENLETLVAESQIIVSALRQNVNPICESWLTPNHVIFDANYKNSPLVEMAHRKQCTVVHAEDWLLNQAVESYKLFLGEMPNREIMREGLHLPTLAYSNRTIATIGIMGAGKSSHGKALAANMGYAFKDVDNQIVERENRPITQIFAESGEAYFRSLEKQVLQENFSSEKPTVLSCGGGIVLNEQNRNLLKNNALVVWLYASPQAIISRIKIAKRPLLQCENPAEKLQSLLTERRDLYAHTAHVVYCTEKCTKYHTAHRLKTEIDAIWTLK